jgi:hypothetical protein
VFTQQSGAVTPVARAVAVAVNPESFASTRECRRAHRPLEFPRAFERPSREKVESRRRAAHWNAPHFEARNPTMSTFGKRVAVGATALVLGYYGA